MKLNVKYFASIRELVGVSTQMLDTQSATLGGLRDELIALGGAHAEGLARGRAVRMALNQIMSDESTALVEGAEVAFFPPVTGG